jgi:hypothetical protein
MTSVITEQLRALPLPDLLAVLRDLNVAEMWVVRNPANCHLMTGDDTPVGTIGDLCFVGHPINPKAQVRHVEPNRWRVTVRSHEVGFASSLDAAKEMAEDALIVNGTVIPWRVHGDKSVKRNRSTKPTTEYHINVCKYAAEGWRTTKQSLFQGEQGSFMALGEHHLFVGWSGKVVFLD